MVTSFFIRMNNKYISLQFSEIKYIEEFKQHVVIVTAKQAYEAPVTIEVVESQLPPSEFCRIHRSFIVNLDHIQFFTNEIVQLEDKALPIGLEYRSLLADKAVSFEANEETEEVNNNIN